MRWFIKVVAIISFILRVLCNGSDSDILDLNEDLEYWNKVGRDEIQETLEQQLNTDIAKNVIIIVANGMDPNTVTATRIHKENENSRLTFERFPHIGLLKTYSVDKKVPDVASSGTALFTGVKTNNGMVGVDHMVHPDDCLSSLKPKSRLSSIMNWAQDAGKNTGLVTNKRVTEATASALYAHSPSQHWECNTNLPNNMNSLCKDIGRQLVENKPGRNFKVIFGGGRQMLMDNVTATLQDPVFMASKVRTDKRDLIAQWRYDKLSRGVQHEIIKDASELIQLNTTDTEFVLGIFANSRFPYSNEDVRGPPSLEVMVEPAIKILHKNNSGFVLMVESGLIDQAHQDGCAGKAIEETIELDKTVQKVVDVLNDLEILNETLIIVTGGHGHTMSINGYPNRMESILGIADRSKYDGVPYTILTYATGSKANFQYYSNNTHTWRADPSYKMITSRDYRQLAAIITDKETYGGGDVAVYARGPMSHLFHSVHESTYVAYVIAYAAKIGPYQVT